MDVTVIIASYGSDEWVELASRRAIPSIGDAVFHHYHVDDAPSVGQLRNDAVDHGHIQGWMCFLDPDDELAPGYFDNLPDVPVTDLIVPGLQQVRGGIRRRAQLLNRRDIMRTNPCPIGTLIHRDTFDAVGRFWDERAWEDWSLFRRVVLAGGRLHFHATSIYRAHVSPHGRNSTVADPAGLHREIVESHERWLNDRTYRPSPSW